MLPDAVDESQYTYPQMLRREVEDVVGEYLFDCTDFRTDDKDDLLRQVYEMTDKRFALAEHFLATKPWDFFTMVEMGTDRMHHGFWKDMDPEHRKHEPGGRYESAILDYHEHVDGLVGRLLDHATTTPRVRGLGPRREAHGRRNPDQRVAAQRGPACDPPRADRALLAERRRNRLVDRTTAWGDGGYYARIFLNVKGREPQGTIDPADYERVRDELAAKLAGDPGRHGRADPDAGLQARGGLHQVNGVAPDLIVHFGDLSGAPSARSAGTRGCTRSTTTPGPTMRTTRRTAC